MQTSKNCCSSHFWIISLFSGIRSKGRVCGNSGCSSRKRNTHSDLGNFIPSLIPFSAKTHLTVVFTSLPVVAKLPRLSGLSRLPQACSSHCILSVAVNLGYLSPNAAETLEATLLGCSSVMPMDNVHELHLGNLPSPRILGADLDK